MFDLAWSEIALIAVIALVVIGPKDLPEAVKGVARAIQKMRRMAGDFQSQVDEVAKDAGVQELRQSINEIRNFDIKGQIAKAVDNDGALRSSFAQDPLGTNPLYPPVDTLPPAPETPSQPRPEAPAFVPPGVAAATAPFVTAPAPVPETLAPETLAPVFTPPPPAPQAPAFVPPAVLADAPRTTA